MGFRRHTPRLGRPPSFRGRGTMAPLLARRSKGQQGRSRERLDGAARRPRPPVPPPPALTRDGYIHPSTRPETGNLLAYVDTQRLQFREDGPVRHHRDVFGADLETASAPLPLLRWCCFSP